MSDRHPRKPRPTGDFIEITSVNPTDHYSWKIAQQLVEELDATDSAYADIDLDDEDAVNVIGTDEFDIDLDFPLVTRAKNRLSSEVTAERIVLLKRTAYAVVAYISFWQAGSNTLAISVVVGNVIIWFLQDAEGRFRRKD